MSKSKRDKLTADATRIGEGIRDRLARLETLEADLSANVSALLDADSDARPALIAARGELLAEQDALGAEIAELKARREAAERMAAEDAYAEAAAIAQGAQDKHLATRKNLDEALVAMRHWRNGPSGRKASDQAAGELGELENAITAARVESMRTEARARDAGRARQEALDALEALAE